jgi:hypothetical protein
MREVKPIKPREIKFLVKLVLIPLFKSLIAVGPGNPTSQSGWIYQGIYNLYKIYSSKKIPAPLTTLF